MFWSRDFSRCGAGFDAGGAEFIAGLGAAVGSWFLAVVGEGWSRFGARAGNRPEVGTGIRARLKQRLEQMLEQTRLC